MPMFQEKAHPEIAVARCLGIFAAHFFLPRVIACRPHRRVTRVYTAGSAPAREHVLTYRPRSYRRAPSRLAALFIINPDKLRAPRMAAGPLWVIGFCRGKIFEGEVGFLNGIFVMLTFYGKELWEVWKISLISYGYL